MYRLLLIFIRAEAKLLSVDCGIGYSYITLLLHSILLFLHGNVMVS
jgi:hypothetical protein